MRSLASLPNSLFRLDLSVCIQPHFYSRCFFVGNGSDVKMFAVSTGLVVRTLKLAHTADESSSVVCVAIDPHHPTQVYCP